MFNFEQSFAILLNNTHYPLNLESKDYRICLLFGGNLNDVEEAFVRALEAVGEFSFVNKVSSVYKTKAWGMPEGTPDFLNQAILVTSSLSPDEFLIKMLDVEKKLGRERRKDVASYESRVIDIDIIFIDSLVLNSSSLVVPHPRMHLRKFVLMPLLEIAGDWVHPVMKKSVREMLQNLNDNGLVEKL